MKATSKEEAKSSAKAQSLTNDNKDMPVYIIHCNRTQFFYVDTNGLIRLWEELIDYYTNGVFTNEEQNLPH